MASKSGRSGSAGKSSPIPHTRIEYEEQMDRYYSVGEKLGEGAFGIVREVRDISTDQCWACKAINKEKAGSSKIKLLEREVSILKKVRHEHIIQLKEVFETSQKMYLVMEFCEGGELSKELKDRETFPETETKTIMSRLASAVSYLHKNDMVHRDIKLENILLSNNPKDSQDHLYIKVTDFGLSVVKEGMGHDNMMMDFCGTPMYMAPEILENKTYSEKCDVWAMGVIMCTLLTGTPPFYCGTDEEKLFEMLKTVNMKKRLETEKEWKNVSKEAKDCIVGMLTVDPAYRLSASEVLNHAWIKGESLDDKNPRNVLEMMKEWRNDLTNGSSDDDSSAINGGATTSVPTRSVGSFKQKEDGVSSRSSTPASRESSAGSITKQGKSSTKSSKPPTRASSRSSLQKTTGANSKSPVEGHTRTPASTGRATKANNHHTARTAATKTTKTNATTSDSQKVKDKRR